MANVYFSDFGLDSSPGIFELILILLLSQWFAIAYEMPGFLSLYNIKK